MKPILIWMMGDDLTAPLQHRILNIILLMSIGTCVFSALNNYWLQLGDSLILMCFASSLLLVYIYLRFNKLQQNVERYSAITLAILLVVVCVMWVLNGGSMGPMALYGVLLSSVAVGQLRGWQRMATVAGLMIVYSGMILLEVWRPDLIIGYRGVNERYIDFTVALITTILINSVLFALILDQYDREHRRLQEYQEKLFYLSYHDTLTGLYNRAYYEKKLDEICGSGVFIMDVDGLKKVNDTYGHEAGDLLLIRVAEVLKRVFRSSDVLCRIGGDEYAALLEEGTELERLKQEIFLALQKENEINDSEELKLQLSVGYAREENEMRKGNLRQLIKLADQRMYQEKMSRRQG